MASTIKIRARLKGGNCEVKSLIKHKMETGLRKDKKTGKVIPAHFIQEVVCKHNDAVVMSANWGTAVSTNPYVAFTFSGAKKGDTIELSWMDNKGEADSAKAQIK
jgi:sulfur-oxidizing protein SoxZ